MRARARGARVRARACICEFVWSGVDPARDGVCCVCVREHTVCVCVCARARVWCHPRGSCCAPDTARPPRTPRLFVIIIIIIIIMIIMIIIMIIITIIINRIFCALEAARRPAGGRPAGA